MIRVLSATQRAVLELLRDRAAAPVDRELRAVEVDSAVAARTRGAVRLGGFAVPLLAELEREGLVASRKDERPEAPNVRGDRPAFLYSITDAGKERIT